MRKILITGGELENKGAQSMTYIVVDELHRRFPEYEIVLHSPLDINKSDEVKRNFNFDICVIGNVVPVLSKMSIKQRLYYLIKGYDKEEYNNTKHFFESIDIMIDISGYGLGSDWNDYEVENYIYRILCAKHFGIKVYLLPQSFGPFEYRGFHAFRMNRIIKKALKYPEVICARELEGYEILTNRYNLNNVIKTYDLVLNNKLLCLDNVFKSQPILNIPKINNNSVAIIPNTQNFKFGNEQLILELYKKCIEQLLKAGKTIYIIRHSNMDAELCEKIAKINQDIILLDEEFSCIDFDHFVKQFDFIIASRYHSVVHAYKNSIPCLTLGWAVKYKELHNIFEQDKYIFNVKDQIDYNEFVVALHCMLDNYEIESKKIKNKLIEVQKNNIFEIINLE